ncbi:MAG: phenylalanine--tRNA ligase subunit beta, partial [Desulfovibrio sp.]|nr:phenylalanine--tRNA ligase subunit beta [Desulfovibrio sp.]
MLAPLAWIKEMTPYEGGARELGDKLTMLGLELDGIINPFQNIQDIIVGFVAQCAPHPDSDHLRVCKVDVGDEILDIVCGAPNVAEGQKVAVAKVGVKLPDGTAIKKAKLRGQPSFGMICSERELGLSDDHDGILVLPDSADVGHKLTVALGLDTEVLDLSITPNRGDCLSILGIARETALAFDLPLNLPELPLIIDEKAPEIVVPVSIKDPELCRLYSGRVLANIAIRKSPMRLRYRLHAIGVRPISNIVDVTNYILHEVGQPLHAFDLDKLAGRRIEVRSAKNGEKLVTLDGRERILTDRDICICDAEKIVGLAGVMGGENTEITPESKNVFIESAVFNPINIRKTSRRLGLTSEASYRFERGVDQRRTIWALDRAAALTESIKGGMPVKSFAVSETRPFIPARIPYSPAKANALLGTEISWEFQKKALEADGCAVENAEGALWTAIQPSWRHDLLREADLIEETGIIYGLDKIEPALPCECKSLEKEGDIRSGMNFTRAILRWGSGLGLNEAVNYSFASSATMDFLNLEKENRIPILNPLSEEQNALRTCLAPGLLDDLRNNLAFGAPCVKMFEIARTFEADKESETGARETPVLGLILSGARQAKGWPRDESDFSYADIKGLTENLFSFLHLGEGDYIRIESHPW